MSTVGKLIFGPTDPQAELSLIRAELHICREQAAILRNVVLMLRSLIATDGRASAIRALESIDSALKLTE